MQMPESHANLSTSPHTTIIEHPGSPANDDAVSEILARGNVPLLVGDYVLAEVASNELTEGLAATQDLSSAELLNLSSALAESINEALAADATACDVAELAANAAALFVLCLRRNNVLDIDKLPACSVSFSINENEARLTLGG